MAGNRNRRSMILGGLMGSLSLLFAPDIGAQDYFDWNVRMDRHGKPSGCFEETPFPIDETMNSYSVKNDEYPNGRTYYLGTKYYVDGLRPNDSGDGLSLAGAKKTITGAIQAAGSGNRTILVRGTHDGFDGIYYENNLRPGIGIDDTQRWMLVGYKQERPVIDGSGLPSLIVRSTGVDGPAYVTLQRLKLQNSGYELIQIGSLAVKRDGYFNWIDLWGYFGTNQTHTGRSGNFYSMGADHTWVFHCASEHSYGHAFKIGDGAANTLLEWSTAREFGWWPGLTSNPKTHPSGLDFPDCGKNRIVRYNIVHTGLFYAIQVRGNQSYDPDGIGLTVFHHNEIYDTTHFQDVTDEMGHVTPCQVLFYNAYQGKNPSNQIYFYANIVRDGADADCYGVYSVCDADSVHIYNNQIYNNSAGEIYVNNQLAQVFVYNNSVYHDNDTPLIRTAAGGKLVLKNNIFYQNGAAALAQVNGDQPIHEYNRYFHPNGSFGLGGLGMGETGGDPQWLELPEGAYQANYFRLTGNLQGVDLSSEFATDFNGFGRINWDMGAYEYVHGLYLGSPIGGETWIRGFNYAITWSSSGVTETVKIELLKAGVLNQVIAENQAVADGFYIWAIPADQATGNDYTVKITAGAYSDTSGNFTIAAPGAPVAQTLAAQSTTTNSAVLRGTLHPMGLATSYRFQYGLTTAYGFETAETTLAAGDVTTTVQASIADLKASTMYHFRLTATNSVGTTEGNDLTFTTSGGGGGGGGGSGDSGGGGGGCFVTALQGLNPWFVMIGLFAGGLGLLRSAKRRRNWIKPLVVLTGIYFFSGTVAAEIIPAGRRINWNPGIPGGIPNYPIGANVKDYGAAGDGIADDTNAIQNAINACSVGQSVYLPKGSYRTTARLNVNKGIVIRGAGPTESRILSDSDDAIIIYVGVSGGGPTGTAVDINSGYAKDSSAIVVADASVFSVGDYVGIYQDNEPGLVYPQGYSTICTWCGFGGNYLTCMAQIARVTNKNGNELTLSQPLYYGFQAALNPKIRKISMIQGFGLEDLGIEKIRNAGASSTGSITATSLANSWIKNVHSRMCLGAHVRMSYSYGCVIRDSFFDDAFLRTGSRSYGIFLIFSNSSNLIENNVLYRVTPAMCMEGGGSGNVFAYNFTKDSFHDSDPTWFFGASAITHGAHPYMNLFEGNALEGMHFDNTWGSSSHNTCFRNHIRRACGQAIYGVKAVDVQEHNYYHNFVGNVLGLVGQTGTWGPAQCNVNNVMWRLGCLSSGAGGNPSDSDVAVRTLRHGNFSMIADDTEWDPTISDHTFPDSYYLTSKPAWFGSIPWPPIGPDVNGFVHKIPAQLRYEQLYGPRALNVTSPNGGETWVRGFSRNITWSSSGVTEPVRIELFKGGVHDSVIADNQPIADGSYAWAIPADQTIGNDYTVKLTAGMHESASGNFSIAAPGAPMAQTLAAQSITTNSAVLRGTVHPMGLATSYRFEYGLTTAYGSTTPAATLNAGADATMVQAAISGLDASTTYHFRLVATNSAGTTQGSDLTFTTNSSGGGGGGSGDAGGGGGGCFVTAAQAGGLTGRCLEWLELAILPAILLLAIVLGGNRRPGRKKKIIMRIGVTVSALLTVCGAAQATTYYVDRNHAEAGNSNAGTESRPWMTVQHAADIMQPGDTVMVKPGIYNERVQPRYSGSAGNRIIYNASGSGVIVRGFYLVARSHLDIIGFEITHNGCDAAYPAIQLNASHYCRILDNNIHHTSQAGVDLHYNTACDHNLVRGNRISYAGINDQIAMGAGGMIIRGNGNIAEYNDISHVGDFTNLFGANNIVRNNYFHDCYYNETPDWNALHPEGHHLDGVQSYNDSATLQRCLVEHNYWRDTSSMSNAHFIMMQGPANRHLLIRNNVVVRGGGYAAIIVDVDDVKFIHNTFADTSAYYPPHGRVWEAISFQAGATGGRIMNNIFYAAARAGGRPYGFTDTTDSIADYNLAFDSGTAPEPNGLFNTDPLFVDYAHDDHRLAVSSPAIDSAGPLTRATLAGTGTVITVRDCRYFCDGFGISEPDWIKVGNNNPVQIVAMDDAANTITVADSITWRNNDPVYLCFSNTVLDDRGAYAYRIDGNYDYSVTLTNPIENASIGGIITVSAEVSNPDLVRQVVFYADGIPIALITQAPYAFNWDTRDLAAGTGHTVEARAYALYAGPTLWKTDAVTIHKLGIFLISPKGGEIWIQGANHNITWSASGVTEPITIELFKGGASQWSISKPIADDFYTWQIPADQATGGDYTVKLTAEAYSDTSNAFTIAAPGAPMAQTLAAQSVTTSSAVLRGTLHPMGLETTHYFEYGLTTAYGSKTDEATLAAGDQVTDVQASIPGLTASTTYHFRVVAGNSEGTTEGNDMTFTTSGGGGSSDDSGGGGGGGGCFITMAKQAVYLWLMGLTLVLGWLVWMRRRAMKWRA